MFSWPETRSEHYKYPQLDNSPEILQFSGFLLIPYCNYPIYIIWDLRVALGLGFELGARIRYRAKASAWGWDYCIRVRAGACGWAVVRLSYAMIVNVIKICPPQAYFFEILSYKTTIFTHLSVRLGRG